MRGFHGQPQDIAGWNRGGPPGLRGPVSERTVELNVGRIGSQRFRPDDKRDFFADVSETGGDEAADSAGAQDCMVHRAKNTSSVCGFELCGVLPARFVFSVIGAYSC